MDKVQRRNRKGVDFSNTPSMKTYWDGIASGWLDDPKKSSHVVVIADGKVVGWVAFRDRARQQKARELYARAERAMRVKHPDDEVLDIIVDYVPTRNEWERSG